jgi:succinate dehydrogenase / fumarate reductase cytochrome b subunit
MATLVTTVTETLRYRGKLGQWSWAFHRLSGLGIVLFVYLHVIDTSWAAFYPKLYAQAIHEYQSPLFTIGEFGLVAAVVYHAINGYRIIYLDWRPHLWHLQEKAATLVFVITVIILIPVFILMFGHVQDFYSEEPAVEGLLDVIVGQVEFAVGLLATVAVAIVLSFVYDMLQGKAASQKLAKLKRPSQIDIWFWKFMRVSGLLILPLVFGHLGMMHVVQGVFDITGSGTEIAGTEAINQTGSALTFVGERWDYLVAGVAVWRIYDGLLLGLIVLHGFYGLYLVMSDYTHHPTVRRGLTWVIVFGAAVLIILGMAALLAGVDETARDIVIETAQH